MIIGFILSCITEILVLVGCIIGIVTFPIWWPCSLLIALILDKLRERKIKKWERNMQCRKV